MKKLTVIFLMLLILLTIQYANAQTDYHRISSIYLKIMQGEMKFEELNSTDKELVLIFHRVMTNDNNVSSNKDEDSVSLRDIQRDCSVYKYSDSFGEIECRKASLRDFQRSCEVYFYDDENGSIECRNNKFRSVQRRCSVHMYSKEYGDISC